MLSFRIIACLDVKDGRVVKGVKFSQLQDAGDPAQLAERYDVQGIDELVLLDVAATPKARQTGYEVVAAVRGRIRIPLNVGGGVRSLEDASRLLEHGADKVCINSAAVQEPGLINRLAKHFGSQCIVVAMDARLRKHGIKGYEILVRSGTQAKRICPVQWAREAQERGAGELLVTSWDRDGTGDGYDLEMLSEVCANTNIPVIASGGASRPEHLALAHHAGAHAALVASMLHSEKTNVGQLKQSLAKQAIEVRS